MGRCGQDGGAWAGARKAAEILWEDAPRNPSFETYAQQLQQNTVPFGPAAWSRFDLARPVLDSEVALNNLSKMPVLDRKALEEACRRVSENTMWIHPKPKDMSDIITTEEIKAVVSRYFEIAVEVAESVKDAGGDPNLVVRAVDYMAVQHAMPPLRDDVRWFQECLDSIALLACPELTGAQASYHPFHDDILYGVAIALKKRP